MGDFLLGGMNWYKNGAQTGQSLTRQYTNLPVHTVVKYSFTFSAMDSWGWYAGDQDKFLIQFDNLPAIEGFGVASHQSPANTCGTWENDVIGIRIFGWIAHTALTLKIKFIIDLNEDSNNESFGARDLELIFANDNPGADMICGYTTSIVPLQNQATCICQPGKFSSNGLISGCTSCSNECVSCYGSGADKCIGCADGYYFDGSRCSPCDSSCVHCTGPESDKCTECKSGFALFNGICISAGRCSSPFTTDSSPAECYSSCPLTTRASWAESCYPPCPASSIIDIDLGGVCQSN